MPFEVSYDSKAHCLRTRMWGSLTRNVVGPFFQEIGRVAQEHGCTRILSDLRRAAVAGSTLDLYQEAGALQQRGIKTGFRRAIVISGDEEMFGFWETVCANQGAENLRIFHDYAEAEAWLLGEQPGGAGGNEDA